MTRIVAMRSINGTNSHDLEYASRREEETDQNRSDSSIRNCGADGVHGRLFAATRRDALTQRTSCPWSPAVGAVQSGPRHSLPASPAAANGAPTGDWPQICELH